MIPRPAILERLSTTVASGRAVLGAGCSAGIIAKCAEGGGADLILVYSTGRSRLMGLPTWRLGNSNPSTLAMAAEILNVTGSIPVIGGAEACDPTRLDLERLLDEFVAAGFSGIINFPTLSNLPDMRRRGDAVGIGFDREVDMVRRARRRDLFTMAYVATPDDSRRMAAAGADCIVTHSGPTTGGLVGYRYDGSLSDLIRDTEQIIQAARAVSPDVVCLIHGGLLATPDEVQAALYQTSAVGFVGASSIERIPIERAVMATTRAFKALRVGRADASAPVEPVAMRAVSLQTSDLGRSEAFYARILGLRTVESHPNRRVMDGHGMTLELMQADGTGMGAGAITLEVRDLDAARHRLVGWGLEVTEEHLAGGRRGLMISDPGGAVVKLRAPTPA